MRETIHLLNGMRSRVQDGNSFPSCAVFDRLLATMLPLQRFCSLLQSSGRPSFGSVCDELVCVLSPACRSDVIDIFDVFGVTFVCFVAPFFLAEDDLHIDIFLERGVSDLTDVVRSTKSS